MDKKDLKNLDRTALDLLKEVYGDISTIELPIKIQPVLELLGLRLHAAEFEEDNVVGAVDRKDGIIYVSEDASVQDKRFIVSHELGHYLLHNKNLWISEEDEIDWKLDREELLNTNDEIEQQANWFAASFLMPEDKVRFEWEVAQEFGGSAKLSEFAEVFGVTKDMARWRLFNLGILKTKPAN
jgi:Zn-dependent peptidase ImmA (M78 family)